MTSHANFVAWGKLCNLFLTHSLCPPGSLNSPLPPTTFSTLLSPLISLFLEHSKLIPALLLLETSSFILHLFPSHLEIQPHTNAFFSKSGFPGGSDGKESACNAGDSGLIPDWEDPLEKGMVTHSSILAWRISWTEEPGRLQCMRSQSVRHD